MKTTPVDDTSPFKTQSFGLQIDPLYSRVHNLPTSGLHSKPHRMHTLLNIHFIITFPTTLRSPSWYFPIWCSEYASYMLRPSYSTSYHSPADIWCRLQIVDFATRARFLFNPCYYFLLCSNILLNTPYSNTLYLCSSPNTFCSNRPTYGLTLQNIRCHNPITGGCMLFVHV